MVCRRALDADGADRGGGAWSDASQRRCASAPRRRRSIRRFLGLEANLGQALGLPRDWAYQVVKNVGNYGEIFERTLGIENRLETWRAGSTILWTKGGLMYSMPFR